MDAVFAIIFALIYAVCHWLIWGSARLASPKTNLRKGKDK